MKTNENDLNQDSNQKKSVVKNVFKSEILDQQNRMEINADILNDFNNAIFATDDDQVDYNLQEDIKQQEGEIDFNNISIDDLMADVDFSEMADESQELEINKSQDESITNDDFQENLEADFFASNENEIVEIETEQIVENVEAFGDVPVLEESVEIELEPMVEETESIDEFVENSEESASIENEEQSSADVEEINTTEYNEISIENEEPAQNEVEQETQDVQEELVEEYSLEELELLEDLVNEVIQESTEEVKVEENLDNSLENESDLVEPAKQEEAFDDVQNVEESTEVEPELIIEETESIDYSTEYQSNFVELAQQEDDFADLDSAFDTGIFEDIQITEEPAEVEPEPIIEEIESIDEVIENYENTISINDEEKESIIEETESFDDIQLSEDIFESELEPVIEETESFNEVIENYENTISINYEESTSFDYEESTIEKKEDLTSFDYKEPASEKYEEAISYDFKEQMPTEVEQELQENSFEETNNFVEPENTVEPVESENTVEPVEVENYVESESVEVKQEETYVKPEKVVKKREVDDELKKMFENSLDIENNITESDDDEYIEDFEEIDNTQFSGSTSQNNYSQYSNNNVNNQANNFASQNGFVGVMNTESQNSNDIEKTANFDKNPEKTAEKAENNQNIENKEKPFENGTLNNNAIFNEGKKQEQTKQQEAEEVQEESDEGYYPSDEIYLKQAKSDKKVKRLKTFSLVFMLISYLIPVAYIVTLGIFIKNIKVLKTLLKFSYVVLGASLILFIVYKRLAANYKKRLSKIIKMLREKEDYISKNRFLEASDIDKRVGAVRTLFTFDLFMCLSTLICLGLLFIPFFTYYGKNYSIGTFFINGIKDIVNNIKNVIGNFEIILSSTGINYSVMFNGNAMSLISGFIKYIFPEMEDLFVLVISVLCFVLFSYYILIATLKVFFATLGKISNITKARDRILNQRHSLCEADYKLNFPLLTKVKKMLLWAIIFGCFGFFYIKLYCYLNDLTALFSNSYDWFNVNIFMLILPAVFLGIAVILFIIKSCVFIKNRELDNGLWFFEKYKNWLRLKNSKEMAQIASNTNMEDYDSYVLEKYYEDQKNKHEKKMYKQYLKDHSKNMQQNGNFNDSSNNAPPQQSGWDKPSSSGWDKPSDSGSGWGQESPVKQSYSGGSKSGAKSLVFGLLAALIFYSLCCFADYFGLFVMGKYYEEGSTTSYTQLDFGKYDSSDDGEVKYRVVGDKIYFYYDDILLMDGEVNNGVIKIEMEFLGSKIESYSCKNGKTKEDFEKMSVMDTIRKVFLPGTTLIHKIFSKI